MRAELIWDGKLDGTGERRSPLRLALPFQSVETVNESTTERQKSLALFSQGRTTPWRNRLIWGDKKYVLPSLVAECEGTVKLIYIDPPFDTGADFSMRVRIPNDEDSDEEQAFTKAPSIIEQKAYRDTWGKGLDSYLHWIYETLTLLYDLLHESGTIFVHVGWQVSSYVRVILDEIFGSNRHLNEIIWKRTPHAGSSKARSSKFPVNHETIFWYAKSESYEYRPQFIPYEEAYIAKRFKNPDNDPRGPWQDVSLKTYSEETFERLKRENSLLPPAKKGSNWRYKFFLKDAKGRQIEDIWTDVGAANSMAEERTAYPTQKPEALLKRIIETASNEGDLIVDCFCGSGTTGVVAEKLRRRWICADLSRFAIHTTRKRLLDLTGLTPFVIQNLGKYERQLWAESLGSSGESEERNAQERYIEFVLELFRAKRLKGHSWLHGLRNGRLVHVGPVDAPISLSDVRSICLEFKKVIGSGKDAPNANAIDILGWDFAFELNEVAKQTAAAANLNLRFLRIPHAVMDKKAVDQGDIHFFELAALATKSRVTKRSATIDLTSFIIPPDDVPEEIRSTVKRWDQWIDYWAVDWDNRTDTFHNEWQAYRSWDDPTLSLKAEHTYDKVGSYKVVVKVIDILGNDTTKTIEIKVS